MRNISMAHFRDNALIAKASYIAPDKSGKGQMGETIAMGYVIGDAVDFRDKQFEDAKTGQTTTSVCIIGQFIGVNYADKAAAEDKGETYVPMESGQCYLPGYFADTLKGMLKANPNGSGFAVELLIGPNSGGKGVPYTYDVRNLVKPDPHSRLVRMMAAVVDGGAVTIPNALSQLVGSSVKALGHNPATGEVAADVIDGTADAGEPDAKPAPVAKGGKKA